MGKLIDLTGQKFGRWTVLSRAEKPVGSTSSSAFWLCECECGTKKIVSGNVLKQGKSKSCGCLNKEPKADDLTGQRFGYLTVLQRVEKPSHIKGNDAYWLCKCDCGNKKVIIGKSLKNGHTITCGCHLDKKTNLTGQRFGQLTVLEIDTTAPRGNGTYSLCKCDCGNTVSVLNSNLTSGHTKSCGCLVSSGEREIQAILEENNINYIKQYSFLDLNSELGYPLRFDFAIINNNKIERLIEFQGEQHYDNRFFDQTVKKNDPLKKEYCKNNNIKLICIPYWKRDKLTLDDLLSDRYEEGDLI